MEKNKRKVGTLYEKLAADYLVARGVMILERNYRNRFGEIDLIGLDRDGWLIFVEVKYRKDLAAGDPAEAVNERKQEKIRKAAAFYLYARGLCPEQPCRFDVVAILGSDFRLLRDAF